MMEVWPDAVVRLEYVLRVDGRDIDSSPEGEPVAVLYGHGCMLPPGLEDALVGRASGPFRVLVPPELAAGPYDPEKVTTVGRDDFPPDAVLEVDEEFYARDENGAAVTARITAVEGDMITVDTNPKLAGKTLEYEGVIHNVREATPEEIDHGHVHGEGGVHH